MYIMTMLQKQGIPYLVKEKEIPDFQSYSPDLIYKNMCQSFYADSLPEEHVWMLCLNNTMKPVSIHEISKGTVNASLIDNKAILTRALLGGASAIILIHNHPSGQLIPSEEDDKTTKKVKKAVNTADIQFLDHIIIGHGYYSYMEAQRL